MVFDEDKHAIDWIFRYGNPELACFGEAAFGKSDRRFFCQSVSQYGSKMAQNYERAALYGEILELIDYSPEIDTYLKITCFPTFPDIAAVFF